MPRLAITPRSKDMPNLRGTPSPVCPSSDAERLWRGGTGRPSRTFLTWISWFPSQPFEPGLRRGKKFMFIWHIRIPWNMTNCTRNQTQNETFATFAVLAHILLFSVFCGGFFCLMKLENTGNRRNYQFLLLFGFSGWKNCGFGNARTFLLYYQVKLQANDRISCQDVFFNRKIL